MVNKYPHSRSIIEIIYFGCVRITVQRLISMHNYLLSNFKTFPLTRVPIGHGLGAHISVPSTAKNFFCVCVKNQFYQIFCYSFNLMKWILNLKQCAKIIKSMAFYRPNMIRFLSIKKEVKLTNFSSRISQYPHS